MKLVKNAFNAVQFTSRAGQVTLAVSLGLALVAPAHAAATATTTATFEVDAINEIALSGTPPVLTVNAAVAGAAPTAVTASQTYAVTTNQTAKISAAIDSDMPAGVTLTATMAPPTGATSLNAVALTAASQDLVSGITGLNESGLVLTYGLSATAAAGVVASSSKTVTYTITAI